MTVETTILRACRRRLNRRRGFYILLQPLHPALPTIEDFIALGGGKDDARRALEWSMVTATSAWRIPVRLVPARPGSDELPRVVGYGSPFSYHEGEAWEALDRLVGDVRRRRPEALARRRGNEGEPALCERCGAEGAETHHVWPRRAGGWDKMTNLERLCRACHRKAEASAAADERAVKPGLHVATVLGLERVAPGWVVGLEVEAGGPRRIFASVSSSFGAAWSPGRRVAVLLEASPDRRFRFRVCEVVDADDDEAIDRIRAGIIWARR